MIDLKYAGITHTNELGAATLGRMQALTQLTINFSLCFGLVDVSAVGEGLAQLNALTQLDIKFGYCSGLVDVSAVGEALAQLNALEKLKINYGECSGLVDVSSFDANYLHHLAADQKRIIYCIY